MGIRLIVEVLDSAPATLTHRERVLLVVLAEDASEDTWITWNSVQSPAVLHRADLSRTQLYEVLKALIDKGALKRLAAGQRNGTAKYRLLPALSPARRDADGTSQSPTSRDTDGSQSPANRDAEDSQSPVTRDALGKFSVPETGTLTEAQCPAGRDFSVPLDGTPTPLPSREKELPAAPDRFAEFWAAYPRKIAKGNGRKAWDAAIKRKADPDVIVQAAKTHATAWRTAGTDAQWIPHPSTWLNGERYDDADLPAAAPAAPAQRPIWRDPSERGTF